MGSMTDHAIGFALDTRWQDLPPEVRHQTKRSLLDTLGALLAGAQTPVGRMMAQVAADQYGGRDATILVDGRKVSAAGAALANGFAANALDIDDGYRMGKDSIGWGCMVGVMSACMARDGFTGVTPLFDDTPDAGWVDNLGRCWEILNLYVKPYAACRWGQPAVAGALSIIRKNRIDPDQIGSIRVRTFAAAARLPKVHPGTTEDAQYSLAFPVAAAILDGEVGPAQMLPPRLSDRRLLRLLDRVTTEVSPVFDAAFPGKTIAEVSITLADGGVCHSGPVEAIWEPPDTLPSDEALETKFRWLTSSVIGEENAAALARLIWEFDQCISIDALLNRCVPDLCLTDGGGQ